MSFMQSDIDQAKQDILTKCAFPRRDDCFLEMKLEAAEIYKEESEIPNAPISEEEVNKFIEIFNQNKSFLFGFKISKEDLSNIRKEKYEYELNEEVFGLFYGTYMPIRVSVEYLVADVRTSEEKVKKGFYLYPIIELVQYENDDYDSEPEILIGNKHKDYGCLKLMEFKRESEDDSTRTTKSLKYVYHVMHNEPVQGTCVHNEMKVVKEQYKKYVASIEINSDGQDTKEAAIDQLGRWLRRLGRGLEIGEIRND